MTDKFKIGQRVRFKGLVHFYNLNGTIVEITKQRDWYRNPLKGNEREFLYKTTYSNYYGIAEEYLEPVYDGDEKSSWSECQWKPLLITKKEDESLST